MNSIDTYLSDKRPQRLEAGAERVGRDGHQPTVAGQLENPGSQAGQEIAKCLSRLTDDLPWSLLNNMRTQTHIRPSCTTRLAPARTRSTSCGRAPPRPRPSAPPRRTSPAATITASSCKTVNQDGNSSTKTTTQESVIETALPSNEGTHQHVLGRGAGLIAWSRDVMCDAEWHLHRAEVAKHLMEDQ